MAKNLINRYVWLVETIYKAGRITFEEINQKWVEKFEEDPIPLRTFHKWRIAAEEMFNLAIECERKGRRMGTTFTKCLKTIFYIILTT